VATATAVALYVTGLGNMQSIGRRLSPQTRSSLTAKQPHTALVCRLMVSTP